LTVIISSMYQKHAWFFLQKKEALWYMGNHRGAPLL